MPDPVTGLVVGGIATGGSLIAGHQANKTAKGAAKDSKEEAARAEALNRERFALAQGYMDPYAGRANIAAQQLQAELGLPQYMQPGATDMGSARSRIAAIDAEIAGLSGQPSAPSQSAGVSQQRLGGGGYGDQNSQERQRSMGGLKGLVANAVSQVDPRRTALQQERETLQSQLDNNPYMDQPAHNYTPRSMSQIPGYQAVMDESMRGAEQSAMNSGSTLYGGRRLQAAGQVGAGVQQSYYSNYMNLLQNMANPSVATNIAGMGVGQGQAIGQQNIASTGMANDYRMQGRGAQNAAISDVLGGAVQLGAGAFAGGYI